MWVSGSIPSVWLQPASSNPKTLKTHRENPPCCRNSQQRLFPTANGAAAIARRCKRRHPVYNYTGLVAQHCVFMWFRLAEMWFTLVYFPFLALFTFVKPLSTWALIIPPIKSSKVKKVFLLCPYTPDSGFRVAHETLLYSHFRRGPAESPGQPHCCPCWAQLGDRKSDKVSQGLFRLQLSRNTTWKIRTTYQTNFLFLLSILPFLDQQYLRLGCETGVNDSASVRPESVVCTEHNRHLCAKLHISSHRDAKGGGAAKKTKT